MDVRWWVGYKKDQKWGQKRGPKKCFRGRQVGAFSVFWHGHTGGPFIFWAFWPFFRKMVGFRGWCNIVRGRGYITAPPKSLPIIRLYTGSSGLSISFFLISHSSLLVVYDLRPTKLLTIWSCCWLFSVFRFKLQTLIIPQITNHIPYLLPPYVSVCRWCRNWGLCVCLWVQSYIVTVRIFVVALAQVNSRWTWAVRWHNRAGWGGC